MLPLRHRRQIPSTLLDASGEKYPVMITYDAVVYPAPQRNRSRFDNIAVLFWNGQEWTDASVSNADWGEVDAQVKADFQAYMKEVNNA